jgi:D-3-phosphoglycerate dehydrogenase
VNARILACDDLSNVGLDILRKAGFEVVARPSIGGEELFRLAADAEALLVRSRTRVNGDLLRAARRLRLVGRAGYGLDTIDVEAASRAGVLVMQSQEGPAVTAAEFTIGMLFALARHIPEAYASMRARKWEKRRYRGVELMGKTLGVVGMGNVGREVVERASALRMRVLVHDPGVPSAEVRAAGGVPADWDTLLSSSDFITVHVPGTARTRGLLDDHAFERMKDGVRVVSCSRGGVVSEEALTRAVRSGRVAGAAVDVFEKEPPWGSALLELPQVIATPHLVASTFEAQINVAISLAEQVRDFFLGGELRGAVNPDVLARKAAPGGSP